MPRPMHVEPVTIVTLLLISLQLSVGCDSDSSDDAGTPDSGGETADSGPADGGRPDAFIPDGGPVGCTEECEIVELALLGSTSCGRRENGTVVCWGNNKVGQLGDGRRRHSTCGTDRDGEAIDCSAEPVEVRLEGTTLVALEEVTALAAEGGQSICAIRAGELWCWGQEAVSETAGGAPRDRFLAEPIDTVEDVVLDGVVDLSNAGGHACMVVGTDRELVCYGRASGGRLGRGVDPTGLLNDVPRPDLGQLVVDPESLDEPLQGVLSVSTSSDQSCARTADAVLCWGGAQHGEFGDGGEATVAECNPAAGDRYDCSAVPVLAGVEDVPLDEVAQVDMGSNHICVLGSGSVEGDVFCWGDNRVGQLGQDLATASSNEPVAVTLPMDAEQIAMGGLFSCARLTDGSVYCWGFNFNGQLGDGVESHVEEACTIDSSSGDCSSAPVQVSGIDNATFLAVGARHACVIRADDSVWCWGASEDRQLGQESRIDSPVPVQVPNLP